MVTALVFVAVSGTVFAVLVLAVATTGRGGDPSRAGSASAVEPVGDAAAGAEAVGDPRTDARAPTERAAELLGVLAEARAAAWRQAAAAGLHAVDAPGSAAARRDTAAVNDLARAGLRFTGLRYRVTEVETLSATADAAVLRARVDTGPYAVTGAAGSTPHPGTHGSPVLVDLVRTEAGWRVSDVRPLA